MMTTAPRQEGDANGSGVHIPMLDDPAPGFRARTTMGERDLGYYRGRWLLFFSHPADFTPVCTSEFVALARAYPKFQALNCELLALSVDSLYAHLAWVRSIKKIFDVEIPFPLIEDPSMTIARAYGMIRAEATTSATVRATFVIDPDGIVRAIIWYPMTTGRSVEELLRLVAALQIADERDISTPEGWQPGQPGIAPAPLTIKDLDRVSTSEDQSDWYFRLIDV